MLDDKLVLSVILPCRNEEKSLSFCLQEIKSVLTEFNINAEIIVSDSSVDRSPEIAKSFDVVLVKHDKEGYGRAYLEGFKAAKGKYIFMADADCTYEFGEIPKFIKYLDEGYDFVIGDRFGGKIENKAMPWLHRYIGRPIFSFLFRVFFKLEIRDIHCGMRAITKEALEKLNLKTTGMEFASEMIIMAVKKKIRIKELPINYRGRSGDSKLRSFSDGWRHLRFLLLYSPLYLFLFPGLILFIFGAVGTLLLYFNKLSFFGLQLYYHPLFITSIAVIVGYQLIFFAFFAKTFAINHLNDNDYVTEWLYKYITIERGGIFGLFLIIVGFTFFSVIFYQWMISGFSELNAIKISVVSFILIALGFQTIFSSFMLSILGIKEK
jgi:glycosyltransferase involved in cell wall biosynthesis